MVFAVFSFVAFVATKMLLVLLFVVAFAVFSFVALWDVHGCLAC